MIKAKKIKSTEKAKPVIKTVKAGSKKKTVKVDAKPKISIKKVTASGKKKIGHHHDDSVVDLKKNFSEVYHEANALLDDEEVSEEELDKEDSNFDWGDLLEDEDAEQKKAAKRSETKKDKKKKHGFKLFSWGKKKHEPEQDILDINQPPHKKIDKPEKLDKHAAKITKKMGQEAIKDLPRPDAKKGLPMRVYRKLAVAFVLLALVLVAAIFYFSMVKATITVKLRDQQAQQSLAFSVYDRDEDYVIPEEAVRGLVKKIDVEQSKVYEVAGSEVIGEEVTGTMTIVNNYNKNQPLVATTRLLSADGKLFRLKSSVNVPAAGKLEVEVYADKPSADLIVGAEHFTIPGLWEGLQDKIYAESQEGAVSYKKKMKRILNQTDIDQAVADLRQGLIDKAKADIDQTYSEYRQKLYEIKDEDVAYEIDQDLGDEVDKFTMIMTAPITMVAFDDGQVFTMAKDQLSKNLGSGQQVQGLNEENFSYKLTSVDLERTIAEVEASFSGQIEAKAEGEILDRNKLINLSKSELSAYLSNLPEVESFDIKISPSFINKTPSLVDRIKVEVKK